jgi:hypothetical protein
VNALSESKPVITRDGPFVFLLLAESLTGRYYNFVVRIIRTPLEEIKISKSSKLCNQRLLKLANQLKNDGPLSSAVFRVVDVVI